MSFARKRKGVPIERTSTGDYKFPDGIPWIDIELDYVMGAESSVELGAKYQISPDMIDVYAEHYRWPQWGIHVVGEHIRKWIDEYMMDFDAVAAGKRVGVSAAVVKGYMARPETIDAVRARTRDRAARLNITQDAVMAELGRVAMSDIRDLYDDKGNIVPVHALPDSIASAVASVEVNEANGTALQVRKIRMHSKMDALKTLLGQMAPARVEITGKDGAPLIPTEDTARRLAFILQSAVADQQA